MPVRYFVECVSKIRHFLTVVHYAICGTVCFQFTHFPCDDKDNIYIYTLSHYLHQIGIVNYYPLFTIGSWNNGMHCMSFYILMEAYYNEFCCIIVCENLINIMQGVYIYITGTCVLYRCLMLLLLLCSSLSLASFLRSLFAFLPPLDVIIFVCLSVYIVYLLAA